MSNQEITLCASNAYNKKFYLNDNFKGLPEAIKEELQIMCVLYTEDVGGVLELVFDEDGNLEFRTSYEEGDFFYDEIGSVLKIKQYQNVKRELLEALETYYRIVFLGEGLDEEE
ncbi:MAG: hypothetical protein IJA07_04275 [Agathobacter sp.]|nr:hypothetical protein [Agathobacter sp.]MBQ3558711.1 hypothetical protein [Agathobacter sp.]